MKFLQNPRVIPRPKSEKEAFLLKKGLSPAEIAAAFESAGAVAVGPDVNVSFLFFFRSTSYLLASFLPNCYSGESSGTLFIVFASAQV